MGADLVLRLQNANIVGSLSAHTHASREDGSRVRHDWIFKAVPSLLPRVKPRETILRRERERALPSLRVMSQSKVNTLDAGRGLVGL